MEWPATEHMNRLRGAAPALTCRCVLIYVSGALRYRRSIQYLVDSGGVVPITFQTISNRFLEALSSNVLYGLSGLRRSSSTLDIFTVEGKTGVLKWRA
jgi:hypothetical protein